MKVGLSFAVAAVVLVAATSSWAQSLTPIQGWVPFDSPKAKALMRNDPMVPELKGPLNSYRIGR
jgi:hypothetical protein